MCQDDLDLSQDPEWLALTASFAQHFWQVRVPGFLAGWEQAARTSSDPAAWHAEIKLALHGLAGVAALVGEPELGDAARAIEQEWSVANPDALKSRLDALAACLRVKVQARGESA